MKQHHNPHRPAAALLLWCLLLLCAYNPATAQHVVRTKDGKPLLNIKKGMYGADFKAPVLHITPPPKFLDSLINVKVGDPFFNIPPTEYGEKIGYFNPRIDIKNHGKLKKVNDSLYVFKINIIIDNAKEAGVNFSHLRLGNNNEILVGEAAKPQKTQMYIYDSKGSFLAGPINKTEKVNAITSNEYIIEIRLCSKENYEKMSLIVNTITFVYLNTPKPLNEKKNAIQQNVSCFNDINCPEGYCWHNESNGVGLITYGQGSGVLLNNLKNDKKLYLLTARHVIKQVTDPFIITVKFKHKNINCGSNATYPDTDEEWASGKTILAKDTLTDVALLELDTVDVHISMLTFAGWTRDTTALTTPIVCISHPYDALYGGQAAQRIATTYGAIGSNLKTRTFSDTIPPIPPYKLWNFAYPLNQAIAKGSSGGPLFNGAHQVIGHVVGGGNDCASVADSSYFGRFDKSWEGSGTPSTRLKDWLDPNNTNAMSCPTLNPIDSIKQNGLLKVFTFNLNKFIPAPNVPYTFHWEIKGSPNVSFAPQSPIDSSWALIKIDTCPGIKDTIFCKITPAGACNNISFTNFIVINIPALVQNPEANPDLALRDCYADIGTEPNTACNLPEWQDIWESPDLWNLQDTSSQSTQNQSVRAGFYNKLMYRIKNLDNTPTCTPSEPAQIKLYWTVASTGENWPWHWIDDMPYDICKIGDTIGTQNIPPILPQQEYIGGIKYTAPHLGLFQNCSADDFDASTIHGDSVQICFLARLLENNQTTIPGEDIGGVTPNILNSNNIVTRNTFLLDLSLDGLQNNGGNVQTKYILIRNNNNTPKILNVVAKELTGATLQPNTTIELILSPQLYTKWVNGGKQVTGLTPKSEYVLQVNDLSLAKIKNLSFAANEANFIGIRIRKTTAKTDTYSPSNDLKLLITHQATDSTQSITPPSACVFDIKTAKNQPNNPSTTATQLTAYLMPNPTQHPQTSTQLIIESPYNTQANIYLYNMQGQLIKSTDNTLLIGTNNITINTQYLNAGMYHIVIQTPQQYIVKKLIKL